MMIFVYSLINFLILAAVILLFGRKTIVSIFRSRRERIGRELDEAQRIENSEPSLPGIPASFSDALPESVEAQLRAIRENAEKNAALCDEKTAETKNSLRRDMLADTRDKTKRL